MAAQASGILATWMLFESVTPRPRWALKNSETTAPISASVMPDLQRAEHVRQRVRQPQLQEHLPTARRDALHQVERAAIHRGQPLVRVHDHRGERHQRHDRDLGRLPEPEPEHGDGGDRDDRDRVQGGGDGQRAGSKQRNSSRTARRTGTRASAPIGSPTTASKPV